MYKVNNGRRQTLKKVRSKQIVMRNSEENFKRYRINRQGENRREENIGRRKK